MNLPPYKPYPVPQSICRPGPHARQVTATRDGMNLVPYEYEVCRHGPEGDDDTPASGPAPRAASPEAAAAHAAAPAGSRRVRAPSPGQGLRGVGHLEHLGQGFSRLQARAARGQGLGVHAARRLTGHRVWRLHEQLLAPAPGFQGPAGCS